MTEEKQDSKPSPQKRWFAAVGLVKMREEMIVTEAFDARRSDGSILIGVFPGRTTAAMELQRYQVGGQPTAVESDIRLVGPHP